MLNNLYHMLDPVAISAGPITIYWYGLAYVVGALLTAPKGSAIVVDVRLGRDMCLDAGHGALGLKEQTPVLDNEGIGAQRGAAMNELQCIAHLGLLDDDVDRDVDARPG